MKTLSRGHTVAQAHLCPDTLYDDLRRVARRLCRRSRVEHLADDVVQAGALGFIEAWVRFDHKRGVPFGAYARIRIEGSMQDEIRRNLPLSRRAWEHGKIHRESDELLDHVPDRGLPVDDRIIWAADLQSLRMALQQLSVSEQAIIAAVYELDGATAASGAAYARDIGRSRSDASRQHRQGLAHLREHFACEVAHG